MKARKSGKAMGVRNARKAMKVGQEGKDKQKSKVLKVYIQWSNENQGES
jgi:hypothetical protein